MITFVLPGIVDPTTTFKNYMEENDYPLYCQNATEQKRAEEKGYPTITTEELSKYKDKDIAVVTNIDPLYLADHLKGLNVDCQIMYV